MPGVPTVIQDNNPRRAYGLGEKGGFTRGMNSVPYSGQGFQVAYNCYLQDGEIVSMGGNEEYAEVATATEVIRGGQYQKSDGTFQRITFAKIGSDYKLRAIEDDGTITTPSGGAGDVALTLDVSYAQISLTGYITDKAASGSNHWSWDGTTLTAITSTPANPTFIDTYNERAVIGAAGVAHFSRSDANPLTVWTGGSGIFTEGNFVVQNSGLPVGGVSTPSGYILAFLNGMERHNINEINDGSAIFHATRDTQFNSIGNGIDSPDKICMGSKFGYIITETDIVAFNPLTGESAPLTENAGALTRYFKRFGLGKSCIAYSPKDKMIVAAVSTENTEVNDLLVCYHEPTQTFWFKQGAFRSLFVVNGQLYGGSSYDGKVMKVFTDKYQNGFLGNRKFRLINEWDVVSSQNQIKVPVDMFQFINGNPDQTVTFNLYINGDISSPILSKTFNISNAENETSITNALGDYTMGVGESGGDEFSDEILKDVTLDTPFITYCWEIVQIGRAHV